MAETSWLDNIGGWVDKGLDIYSGVKKAESTNAMNDILRQTEIAKAQAELYKVQQGSAPQLQPTAIYLPGGDVSGTGGAGSSQTVAQQTGGGMGNLLIYGGLAFLAIFLATRG